MHRTKSSIDGQAKRTSVLEIFLLQNRMTQGFVVDRVQANYLNLDQSSSDRKSVLAAVCVFGELRDMHAHVIGLGSQMPAASSHQPV